MMTVAVTALATLVGAARLIRGRGGDYLTSWPLCAHTSRSLAHPPHISLPSHPPEFEWGSGCAVALPLCPRHRCGADSWPHQCLFTHVCCRWDALLFPAHLAFPQHRPRTGFQL